MLVSAARTLKFHSLFDDGSAITYKPSHPGNINSISLSKDNGFLTFITENRKPEIISLKDPDNIKNVHTISSVNGASVLAFERTTKRIIGIGMSSGQIALYDTKNKSISKLFQNAPYPIKLLDFNVDDKQMAVSGTDGTILLYDTNKTEIRESYVLINSSCPTAMRFHPCERRLLAVGTENGTVMQWDVEANQDTFSTQVHAAPITGLVAIKNSNFLISVGLDHKFCIYDTNIAESIFRSNLQHILTAVDVNFNGHAIAIGTLFGDLYIYDIRNLLSPMLVQKSHDSRINKVLFDYKIKDDFIDAIPESQSEAVHLDQEIVPKEEDALMMQNTVKDHMEPEVKIFNADKLIKNVPNLQMKSNAKNMASTVTNAISEAAEEIQFNLSDQLKGLHSFIMKEFHTIEGEFQEKWDFRNLNNFPSEPAVSQKSIE